MPGKVNPVLPTTTIQLSFVCTAEVTLATVTLSAIALVKFALFGVADMRFVRRDLRLALSNASASETTQGKPSFERRCNWGICDET
jgi:hypothetical protein